MSTQDDFIHQLQAYCSYRERSPLEVERKALQLEIPEEDIPTYLRRLEEGHFLSARRFARSYALGKWRNNRWGKIKIQQGLRQAGISSTLRTEALATIDGDDYCEQLEAIAKKKWEDLPATDAQRWAKAARYLAQRGFETDLFLPLLQSFKEERED
jgi:regulatory protein